MREEPQADQEAAAARERSAELRAAHDGQEVIVRTITVEVTPEEAEALARGEMPPGVRVQLGRILAEDEVIVAPEREG